MSLMGTLAKVAIGVAVAKGVGGMVKGAAQQRGGSTGNGGLFGGAHSPGAQQKTGLEDVMGDLLGGKSGGSAGAGGLGGILEQLAGGGTSRSGGGLGDIIGGLAGAAGGRSGGGLGDLIGGLAKGAGGGAAGGGLGDLLGGLVSGAPQKGGGSFGDILNDSLQRRGEPATPPSQEQEATAGLMLAAMIQAAKSDGVVDEAERKKLLDNLGDVSPQEKAFVQAQLSAAIDVNSLASAVPNGMESQVYLMSLMGINLDNQKEAQYLHDLATAMNIGKSQVNAIHDHLGVPKLYT